MRVKGSSRALALFSALVLAIVGATLAWVCVRSAMVRILPAAADTISAIAPHHPDVIFSRATLALVEQRGIIASEMLAEVRQAARSAPLDARAYLVLGHQQLLDDRPEQAVRTLEAGQRLDPRNRLIHLLLLDRYLRTARYADAAAQFAVSSRLVGPAQGAIAAAMAQMSLAPETSDAVRRTLRTDPTLERAVLMALAKSDTAPSTIFALASPGALRAAGNAGNWGSTLVARLVERQRFAAARSIWQTVYRLAPAKIALPVFDAGFSGLPGSAPFNWTLVAGSLGAADIRDGTLSISYYGRDAGVLAGQLLVLAPGTYRFAITVDGSKTGTGPSLSWSLQCATGDRTELFNVIATATGKPHRIGANFIVPAGCPAQQLSLTGNPGEFPAQINLTLRDLDLRAAGATR